MADRLPDLVRQLSALAGAASALAEAVSAAVHEDPKSPLGNERKLRGDGQDGVILELICNEVKGFGYRLGGDEYASFGYADVDPSIEFRESRNRAEDAT